MVKLSYIYPPSHHIWHFPFLCVDPDFPLVSGIILLLPLEFPLVCLVMQDCWPWNLPAFVYLKKKYSFHLHFWKIFMGTVFLQVFFFFLQYVKDAALLCSGLQTLWWKVGWLSYPCSHVYNVTFFPPLIAFKIFFFISGFQKFDFSVPGFCLFLSLFLLLGFIDIFGFLDLKF